MSENLNIDNFVQDTRELIDFIKEEKIFRWSIYDSDDELIVKTNKQTLRKLYFIDRNLQKQVQGFVKDDAASIIKVRLKP